MRQTSGTKSLPKKLKRLMAVGLLILICFSVLYILIDKMFFKNVEEVRRPTVLRFSNVVVHLDMKGSPLKLSYLKSLLPKLQDLGVTGLLMEYEDMFPYENTLVNLSSNSCYEKTQLNEFLKTAVKFEFDIIPLVQTFGHMEHVLKLAEFQHLREVPISPSSICPSQFESQVLIEEMLEQVIKFHENIFPLKYIHIGCNEILNLNQCHQCLQRKLCDADVYSHHLNYVRDIVRNINANIAVLAWDDVFREFPQHILKRINSEIEPVYWNNKPNLNISYSHPKLYHDEFRKIWIATSFKGADGRTAMYPNLRKRFLDHIRWLNQIVDYKFGAQNEAFIFEGIILTGLSRYSHMDPPCELFPISLPSLFLNLLLIRQFNEGIEKNEINNEMSFYKKYLRTPYTMSLYCSDLVNLDEFDISNCYFEGNELYRYFIKWDEINNNILNTINNVDSERFDLDFHNINKKYSFNMLRLNLYIERCYKYISELVYFKKELKSMLGQYYDENFIQEYIHFKLSKTNKKLQEILMHLNNKTKSHTWDRRP